MAKKAITVGDGFVVGGDARVQSIWDRTVCIFPLIS
jgi:hypothetical protein